MKTSYLAQALLLVLSCLASTMACADNSSLLVGLHIQENRLNLRYPTSTRTTDISQLDLRWNQPLSNWLQGSIQLSGLYLTQSSNPIPLGQSTRGRALGIGLLFHLYRGNFLRLQALMHYQYANTDVSATGQSVTIRWHQLSAELRAQLHVMQYSYVTAAIGAVGVDGNEVDSGTTTASQSFHSNKAPYGILGFSLGLDPYSHIEIEISTGSMAGVRIAFQRWY